MGNLQTVATIVVAVSVFGLVLSAWIVLIGIRSVRRAKQAERLEHRLGLHDEPDGPGRVLRLWHDGREATTTVPGKSRRMPFWQRAERLRRKAGWVAPVRTILLGLLGAVVLLFAIALMALQSWLAAVGLAATALLAFWMYLQHRIRRNEAIFDRQLLDALGLACQSLRAGHPLIGSFRLIADQIGPPIGPLFADLCQRQALGADLEDAIREVAQASDNHDMEIFATSVSIQLRSGGNLVEMMERLATVIRDRTRLSRRVRVLTAQTQFSKRVLLAMPFVVFAGVSLLNPDYLAPLFNTTKGHIMLALSGTGLLIGAWAMNRMSKLRY